ncbi:MAG: hypothetical protein ACXW3D_05300 [Caulobacteraceae bacterium]
MQDDHSRPPQEPAEGDPERSVAAPTFVWVMLGLVAVAVFTLVALMIGGKL